ncbi:FixH family protein [Mesorhizobium sp. M1380]|uniref:FixH family protein n=1 Tax=Mesorhizobium sp. M1380 TaxID=2957093 RepID=UPI0033392875
MPALGLAFFATIIIVELTMAVLASRSWTGFVVKNSYVESQEFDRKATRGQDTGGARMERPLQSQMARSATA